MPHYELSVLDLALSFTTEVDSTRVQKAKELLEKRYTELNQHGSRLSKERLLTYLALGLADELLQAKNNIHDYDQRLTSLLDKLHTVT